MGIDIVAGGRYTGHKNRTAPKSDNPYLKLLVNVYTYLNRRAECDFNKNVLKRMYMSKMNRAPISVSRMSRYLGDNKDSKIGVVVGTVTDDTRMVVVPKMRVCALRFTEGARARIVKAGGECLTFDQLALQAPKGENCMLFRGRRSAREAHKHFGTPGSKGDHAKPYVRSKGRKFERARGRRASRGFKI